MAIVVENIATGTDSGTDTAVSKPTGLAEGDVMVVTIATENEAADFTDESGWTTVGTLLETGGTGTPGCRIYIKEASAGDVAGSGFTFDHPSSITTHWSIARISGATITGYQWSEHEDVAATTTPTYTPGVTPTNPNSLLLLFVFSGVDSDSFTVSGYAIANASLTWTERYETSSSFNEGVSIAYATAPKTGATATGNFSATLSASTVTSGGLLALNDKNITVSPAVIPLTATIPAPTVTGGANVSPSVIGLTASVQNPSVATEDAKWINEDKTNTNPTVTNETKS